MKYGYAACAAGLLCAGAARGQVWNETGDAGDQVITAQYVGGSGTLSAINGTIGADDADFYAFEITSPTTFSASTLGTTSIDTQLFLFRQDGTGIVFDDDAPGSGTLQSALSSAFTSTLTPGVYFLAISTYDKDPVSGAGAIWNDTPFDVERAPDGPGAGGAMTGWEGGEFSSGPYSIALTGTSFTTPPVMGACNLPGGCVQATAAACAALGGSYQGNGTSCPSGACCQLDGTCSTMTEAACLAANGLYGGPNSACGSACPHQYVWAGPSVAIPDGQVSPTCGTGPGPDAVAEITVNESFTISDISVSFYIEHTWQGDLMISLRHVQTGTTAVLVDRPGATGLQCGFGNDNYGSVQPSWFRLLDSAAVSYDLGAPGAPVNDVSGAWKPEGPMTPFVGEDSAGQWQLIVSDWSELDIGFINSFILELEDDGGCYPDCDGDGNLTLADFGCFQTKFALGDPYADCNGDAVLNLADFGCFQTAYALGCP